MIKEQSHSSVIASYGLCLSYDEYISNRCVWIVDLKDGTTIFQDDDRPGVKIPSAWKRLRYYVQDYPENKIAKMRLRLGTHVIELPSEQPFYFYSRGLLQSMTQTHGLDFHIVGWPDGKGCVACTWYKAPELVITEESTRPMSKCAPEQLIGDLTDLVGVL